MRFSFLRVGVFYWVFIVYYHEQSLVLGESKLMDNRISEKIIPENDPALKSFINISPDSHFPIQNLPFGLFCPKTSDVPRAGVAIGDSVLDLSVIEAEGLFNGPLLKNKRVFSEDSLNA